MKDTVEETNIIKLKELATSTIEHREEVISRFLQEKINLLSMLTNVFTPEYFATPANVERLFFAMNPTGNIVDLQVIDASGKQQAYVGPYRSMIEGKMYQDALWFKETLLSGVHISDVFAGYRNTPHFVVAVTDPLKTYVLRATINSSIFNSLLHSAQLGPSGDAFIINHSGDFQTPSLQNAATLSDVEKSLISFKRDSESIVTDTDVYVTRSIGEGKWLLVLKARFTDSLDYYLQIRNRILIIVIVISVLSMAAATYTSTSLTRKLEQSDREYASINQQIVQVEKMATVGRLAAGIAHEINNPLQMITSLAGWTKELLPDENPETVKHLNEYEETITKIQYHVKRAATVTHRLLGFSRKMTAEKEQVDINNLLDETISFLSNEAQNNSITIKQDMDTDLPRTMTDGPQLQQVFFNVLNNSIDAIGQDGTITITSHLDKSNIVIEMVDNGPGFSPEAMKKVFDPFFTTKEPGKGTGLGMSICYDIMQKLGGSIDIRNGQQRGAIVTLTVPVVSSSTGNIS
jgi:two-component system NtrC family sensor kinase